MPAQSNFVCALRTTGALDARRLLRFVSVSSPLTMCTAQSCVLFAYLYCATVSGQFAYYPRRGGMSACRTTLTGTEWYNVDLVRTLLMTL